MTASRTHCDKCGRQVETLTEINPEGGWGRPRYVVCDACLQAAEDGSLVAQVRDAMRERGDIP